MIFTTKKCKIGLLVVLSLVFFAPFFLSNNTFAEGEACKSLVAKAMSAGFPSKAVSVCVKKNESGKLILTQLSSSGDYAKEGFVPSAKVASEATIIPFKSSNNDRYVYFRGNGNSGTITVGRKIKEERGGGTFAISDYGGDSSRFLNAVLSAGRNVLFNVPSPNGGNQTVDGNDIVGETRVKAKGGITITGARCYYSYGYHCQINEESYGNSAGNAGYTGAIDENHCFWNGDAYSANEGGAPLVCGGTPSHDEELRYHIYIKDEDPELAQQVAEAATTAATTDDEGGESEPSCMSEAETSIAWILCPVVEALESATNWAYEKLLEPALQIDPQLFTQELPDSDGNSVPTTRQAWDVFRNIANIVFIILLLAVIFSQLTGVGIDNYGIKKALPKLIVAAILVNLSYWVCVIMVDLSNIVGNSLQDLLASLPPNENQLPDTVGDVNIGGRVKGIATFAAILGVLVGSVGLGIMAAGGGVAFLVSILVAALSAVVSIFFLFLLLAAREAAIVVLVVLSPLAFACNTLPNTQNLFKKWWQLGWKLLLVYPIAGLLIGGGDYVSRLLLLSGAESSGFFAVFAAIIAGIVPIFFIPSVLKKSFAALGDLGSKISGIGKATASKVSGNVGKTVQGSQRFQNYQADRGRQRKIKAADRVRKRYQGRDNLSDRQKRALGQAMSISLGEQAETAKRDRLRDGGYDAAIAGIQSREEEERIKDEEAIIMNSPELRDNVGALQEELSRAISGGDTNKIRAYQNVLSRKGDIGREASRQAMVDAKNRGAVSESAERAYASNLMNNWANDYKNDNRSTFDYAGQVLRHGSAELTADTPAAIGSLKTPQAASMDDGEFERLLRANGMQLDGDGRIIGGIPTEELKSYLRSAFQDQNAMMGAKESRRNMIRQIVGDGQGS